MRLSVVLAAAIAAATLAACGEQTPRPRTASQPAASPQDAASGASAVRPSTSAEAGRPPSTEEKKEGANPVQQQVDPKEAEQRRDFQMRGDEAGPKSPETQPKNGG